MIAAFSPDSPLTSQIIPSPNFSERKDGKRPDCVVLHYTGMPSADGAIGWLATPQSQVSAHYVVRENGAIVQMVAEAMRAWHAGKGVWQGETDINSVSIGIEIAHPGHPDSDPTQDCPPFPDGQIQSVMALVKNIVMRHRLDTRRILAHSDLAPRRKIDPGETFPWARLADFGLGLFAPAHPLKRSAALQLGDTGLKVRKAKALFGELGFGVSDGDVFDEDFAFVVKAFQRHWRPERIDGVLDVSTRGTLKDLLKRI